MSSICHVCGLPIWEYDYYWDTLYYLEKNKSIDLTNLPKDLKKYNLRSIKKVLIYEEGEDVAVKRINKTKWIYLG